jgi:hypothetical protein
MKKLIIVWLSLLAATGVSAQRGYHGFYRGGYYHGGGVYVRPRVSIGIGLGAYAPFYPYYGFGYGIAPFFGYPYFGYPSYGYPYYGGSGYSRSYSYGPSRQLELQIQEIRNDYDHRIWQVKHDKSIRRKERKKQVHQLEHDRESAIIQAKKDFYSKPPQTPRRHNFNSNSNSNS